MLGIFVIAYAKIVFLFQHKSTCMNVLTYDKQISLYIVGGYSDSVTDLTVFNKKL